MMKSNNLPKSIYTRTDGTVTQTGLKPRRSIYVIQSDTENVDQAFGENFLVKTYSYF